MAYQLSLPQLAAAFAAGGAWADDGVAFEVVELGRLRVTSGFLAASDPFVDPRPKAFTLAVPCGLHPVRVAIARFPHGDERIAFARVDFVFGDASEAGPVPGVERWPMALVAGQDPERLGPDEFYGYGVDAGTGCFMDAATGALLDARMAAEEAYYEVLIADMQASYRHTRSWLDVRPVETSPLNVILFSSGYGDGAYPSFFGLGADGRPLALVTDFQVLGQG